MTQEQAFLQAFVEHPAGVLFGIGFCILCVYFGMSLLFNGWPEFRSRRK